MRTVLIAALAAAAVASAQTYSLVPFAGGPFPENALAISASLGPITGLAVDRNGAVYLSLADYGLVLRADPVRGTLSRVADPVAGPAGLAVDGVGRLYIAEAAGSRVRMAADGAIADVAGNGTPGFGGDQGSALAARLDTPLAVAIGSDGAIYIADFYNHVVRKVVDGIVTTVAGTGEYGVGDATGLATETPLAGPSGLAADAAGNLYIVELYANRVRRLADGILTTVPATASGTVLKSPTDVAIDATGNLYIADYGNNRVRMISPNGVMTVVAGNGGLTSTGDNGPATSAGLAAPRRIAVDPAGNLLIADDARIRKVVKGVISTVAGGGVPAGENGPALAAQLMNPRGLTLDPAGALYLSDPGTGRVLKVAGGMLTRVGGTGVPGTTPETGPVATTPLGGPAGIAVDSAGAVYVADTAAARIRKISGGTVATLAGGLTAPDGLAIGANGTLYFSDGHRVRSLADGAISAFAGSGSVGYQGEGTLATAARLSSPTGVAVDPAGTVYIADTGNGRIRQVANGIITTVPGAAALNSPVGVAADAAGDVYVTEPWRVLKLSKGKLTVLAGFDNPQGVAVDATGNVYVADPANHRVAVLKPAGTSCAVTVATPPAQPAAGGPLPLTLATGTSCPWAIDGLPSWIALTGLRYGTGPSTLTAAVAPNPDVPRSATLTVGAQTIVINQAGIATLSGVVTRDGKPLPGVTVTLSGAATLTATTDAGGNYAFPNLPSGGPYTVTPAFSGFGFVPASTAFTTLTATPAANFAAWTRPRVAAMTPAAYAPGQIVTIWGADLCGPAASANPTLPDRLASCFVRVDSTAIRLYYASPTQINAVLPQTLAPGAHQLTVQRYTTTAYSQLAAASDPLPFTVSPVAVSVFDVLHSGDLLTIYATGLGRKAQTFSEGAAPGRTSNAVETIKVTVDGQPATVLYSGVQPQYPGLDQINVRMGKTTRPSVLEIAASGGQVVRYLLDK